MHALMSYLTVMLAVTAGIVGMGITFNGVLAGNLHELTLGIPPLLIGLWWAGRELARGMAAGRRRYGQRARHRTP